MLPTLPLLLLGLTLPAQDGPAGDESRALMLHLRDGATHWGRIVEHDPDGFRFELLSHGGSARVPWSLLAAGQSEELRRELGYVDLSADEILIDADLITLATGEEIVGRIVSREGDLLQIKAGGNLIAMPEGRVRAISRTRVPALDVYSREELYNRYAAEAAPDDPEAQLELARTCEKILDYAHAVEHYRRALELAPAGERPELELALARAERAAEQQAQIDYLREVDQLRKRGHFDRALDQIAAFAASFPGSPLQERARRLEGETMRAREAALAQLVRRQWEFHLRRLAGRAARLETYAESVAYAGEQLSQEIQAAVLEDAHRRVSERSTASDVLRHWIERKKLRYELASYGLGTWLLGEDRALAGIEEREAEAPVSETDRQRQELREKMERFVRNQELARRARSRQDQAEDFEAFWSGFSMSSRAQWIRAYYVENSGDMELAPKPRLEACPTCGGSGAREIVDIGGGGASRGGSYLQKCNSCGGLGIIRRVRYR